MRILPLCLFLAACAPPADAGAGASAAPGAAAAPAGPPPGARGKRAAPPEVAPVQLNGVTYRVLHWGRAEGLPQNGGYLEALDGKGQRLWLAQVFAGARNPALEGDVQDVFFTELKLAKDGRRLWLRDEQGREFLFDPATRKGAPAPAP
ncbi:hypothetical protein V8J88_23960 [Massilia sp. W12]|uniref:hypothetical protein n=1 Tax=Massilia sp. W12 TaxID=3126507 RepID=UPI0030D0D506